MNTINRISVSNHPTPVNSDPQTIAGQSSSMTEQQATSNTVPPKEAVNVTLSVEGLRASASAPATGASSAATQAKEMAQLRERIKELQQQIQEKQAELQAAQADKNLSAEQKAQRVSAASQQLASLDAALATANTQLLAAMKGKPQLGGADSVQPIPYVKADSPQGNSTPAR